MKSRQAVGRKCLRGRGCHESMNCRHRGTAAVATGGTATITEVYQSITFNQWTPETVTANME